ncbi:hypothetical protein BGZ47_007076 [Haplosporangium gracile]|nr:hypothetical protein BGZ47_007076 [Haplosporangium gracile]
MSSAQAMVPLKRRKNIVHPGGTVMKPHRDCDEDENDDDDDDDDGDDDEWSDEDGNHGHGYHGDHHGTNGRQGTMDGTYDEHKL